MEGVSRGNKEKEEEEDRALQTRETTIGLHLTKRHEGNVINPIDSHYSRRGRQRENRHTSAGCAEASWWFPCSSFFFFIFFLSPFRLFFLSSTSRKLAAGTSCCSAEPINVCSQRGEEHSESQLFPQAMGNEEVGETVQREEEGRGGWQHVSLCLLHTEKE